MHTEIGITETARGSEKRRETMGGGGTQSAQPILHPHIIAHLHKNAKSVMLPTRVLTQRMLKRKEMQLVPTVPLRAL
jgi:hypothetical protein